MINPYQSSVQTFSSEELRSLSAEIEECFHVYDEDGAEVDRYWEMQREIRRRWELANPEEAAREQTSRQTLAPFIAEWLRQLHGSMVMANMMNRGFEQEFVGQKPYQQQCCEACMYGERRHAHAEWCPAPKKVGSTIMVRRPARYNDPPLQALLEGSHAAWRDLC